MQINPINNDQENQAVAALYEDSAQTDLIGDEQQILNVNAQNNNEDNTQQVDQQQQFFSILDPTTKV